MTIMRLRCAFVLILLWAVLPSASLAGIPPAGFQETVVLSGLPQVNGFDWDPNGDLWIIQKTGTVQVLRAGATVPTPVHQFSVDTLDERGLLGIALDPDFLSNGYLYFYYTTPSAPIHNRVSRFTVVGDMITDELILLEGPTLSTVFHNAGCLRFGVDNLLYISMGDNAQPGVSQDRSNLFGSILRIAPDGSIPASNPFVGDPNSRDEIWAYGLRNPWRFNVEPHTGNLFIGDVGDGTWEELSIGIEGANYGYPQVEGPSPPGVPGITYPVFWYNHFGQGASIIGGDHIGHDNFPAQYEHDYFYADFVREIIYRLKLDGSNEVQIHEEFVTDAHTPVHIANGPDDMLYYASIGDSTIYRIEYVGGTNQQPVPVALATPSAGRAPLDVFLDGSNSFDPDGGTLTYRWIFGDNTGAAELETINHTYVNTGIYTATLEVSDGQDTVSHDITIVVGNDPPVVTILSPMDGASFNAGNTINFSATATDPQEGVLGPSAFVWSILFHHNTHIHPYLGPLSGQTSGSFVTATTGETDPDIWYEIHLTVSDTGGVLGSAAAVSTTRSINIYPNLSTLNFMASPRPDLMLTLDGKPLIPPRTIEGVVGVQRTLGVVSPQSPGDGHTYSFSHWGHSPAAINVITTPAFPMDVTANFTCNVIAAVPEVTMSHEPSGDVRISWIPAPDPCLSSGPSRYRVYVASTRLPSVMPGSFPDDPPFTFLAETDATTFVVPSGTGIFYYLIEPMGSDGNPGPVGHYGR